MHDRLAETATVAVRRTALLAIDLQTDVVHAALPDEHSRAALTSRVNAVTTAARQARVPVVFVTTTFRDNYPCVPESNAGLRGVQAAGVLVDGSPGARLLDGVHVDHSDFRVVKRRASAFVHCETAALLSGLDVGRLIVFGVSTSGCVLSTVRSAADLDYRLVVVHDCCADRDAVVHQLLRTRVFPSQAHVITSTETCEMLTATKGCYD
jgi:nicotinamidase-related amidase